MYSHEKALASREGKSLEDAMARFFCEGCQKESNFLPIYVAMKIAGVSRRTIYYWLEHRWVHCRELPSGRPVICETSLSRPKRPSRDLVPEPSRLQKARKTVQPRAIP